MKPLPAYRGITALEKIPAWAAGKFSAIEVPEQILDYLGKPQDQVPAVHVAGTNGKGSVCAFLAAIFRAQGKAVEHFASPHLTHVTERCLIDGSPVPLVEFDIAIEETLLAARELRFKPSYFVVSFIASMLVFSKRKLDIMVVEVGLGGVYDATNLLASPLATVVTNIGYDHTHILGESLAEIARNKAGIFKSGVPAFVGNVDSSLREFFTEYAIGVDAPLSFGEPQRFIKQFSQLVDVNPLLCAPHQLDNAALAAEVAEALGVSPGEISSGVLAARWPGRNEILSVDSRDALGRLSKCFECVLDCSHNPGGITGFLTFLDCLLERKPTVRRLVILLGILQRKEWREMARLILLYKNKLKQRKIEVDLLGTSFSAISALEQMHYREVFGEIEMFSDVDEAVLHLHRTAHQDILFAATGSIYFIGELRPLLTDALFKTIEPHYTHSE